MKCPKCGVKYDNFITKCAECHYQLEKEDFQCYIDEYISKYQCINKCPEFPSNSGEIIFKNINLDNDFDHEENIGVEDWVIDYYNERGFNAFFAENNYWIVLFLLCFSSELDLEFMYNFNVAEYINDCGEYINYDKLANYSDLINGIIDSYFEYLSRVMINENTRILINYFSVDELLLAPIYLNYQQLSLIFERLASDFDFFSSGFPDLIVYDDESFFFVEVKSKQDSLSSKQIQWHKFLSEVVNLDIVIFTINKTENQINFMKSLYDVDLIDFNERKCWNCSWSSDKILITPKDTYTYLNKQASCYVYEIIHSSGKKPEKELLEVYYYSDEEWNNRGRSRWGDEYEFIRLMKENKNRIKQDDVTRIRGKYTLIAHFIAGEEFLDYYKSIQELKEDILYNKARELFYPNVFADFRPTKKQLSRNRDAKLFEAKGNYDKARKLYEKNVSESTGSSTPYKKLIKFYLKFNDYYRIIEIMNIAIPIFLYLNDKNNVLYFLNVKYDAMIKSHYSIHNKYITKEENDYLYENCCKDSVKKDIEELFDKWRKEVHPFLRDT